ncbi:hypothetical protein BJ944DRAFT_54953 [Cunninghamella echinulata]|nr:hypothetical protein BJ944DRAFT_54953 [Cunninghamella echinulata]
MRCTTGTKKFSIMPPSLNECMIAFTTIYKKQNTKGKKQQPHTLTNGAKALSKHWHRDRETGFWGNCTGSDSTKNLYAVKVLFRIMTNAVWINMHSLPHDEIVYEIREINGYGARWTTFNQNEWTFRGFLEPQMENGHEIGWVH